MKRPLVASAAFAIIASLAGCSGTTTPGTPSATSPIEPSATPDATTSPLPYAGAPRVPNPLPSSITNGDPCADFLTPEQVKLSLGTPTRTKRADEASIGPGCDWANTETAGHIIAAYATALPDGLSAVYKNIKPKANPWREFPSIQGFPAVGYVTPSGGSPDEFCQVSIGVNDGLTVELSVFLGSASRGKSDPCEVGQKISDRVMTSLRQKAGS